MSPLQSMLLPFQSRHLKTWMHRAGQIWQNVLRAVLAGALGAEVIVRAPRTVLARIVGQVLMVPRRATCEARSVWLMTNCPVRCVGRHRLPPRHPRRRPRLPVRAQRHRSPIRIAGMTTLAIWPCTALRTAALRAPLAATVVPLSMWRVVPIPGVG